MSSGPTVALWMQLFISLDDVMVMVTMPLEHVDLS